MIASLEKALKNVKGEDAETVRRASKHYLSYVEIIKNADVKNFTLSALEQAPYQFWIAPSSSSGKFHPPEDNGTSGSIRHLTKAAEIAKELSRAYGLEKYSFNAEDDVLSATLLHDICKNGAPGSWGDKTDNTHGLIAYNWLQQFKLNEIDKIIIRDAVRYHMWRWCAVVKREDVTEKNKKEAEEENQKEVERAIRAKDTDRIVQLADYLSSRDKVSFMPGINVTDSPIYIRGDY